MPQANRKPAMAGAVPDIDLEPFRKEWRGVGFSTEPAQRKEAEAAVQKIYAAAGLPPPRKIVWCGSPFSQGLARAIVLDPEFFKQIVQTFWKHALNSAGTDFNNNILDSFRGSMRLFDAGDVKRTLFAAIKEEVRTVITQRLESAMSPAVRSSAGQKVWDTVWESVWESVWDAVMDNLDRGIVTGVREAGNSRLGPAIESGLGKHLQHCVGEPVKNAVWETLMDKAWANIRNGIESHIRVRVWEDLWKSLQTSVWENVALRLGEQVKACGNDSAQASGYGQHDAYWLAFYAYFREAHGMSKETEPVAGLLELARSAGWFAPHAQVCWICERPSEIVLDAQGRLHADEGPALAYRDGWRLYATEGTLRTADAAQPA